MTSFNRYEWLGTAPQCMLWEKWNGRAIQWWKKFDVFSCYDQDHVRETDIQREWLRHVVHRFTNRM